MPLSAYAARPGMPRGGLYADPHDSARRPCRRLDAPRAGAVTSFEYAAQLAGGVALFWMGLAGFRRSIGVPGARTRILVALVTLAAMPVGVWVSGLAELVGILAITVVALAMDANTSGRIVRASSEIG